MRSFVHRVVAVSTALALIVPATTSLADPVTVRNAAPAGGSYVPVPQFRLFDTHTTPKATSFTITAAGAHGIPTHGVAAVAVTLTVVTPPQRGYAVGYRNGSARPYASNLSFSAGQTASAATVLATDEAGRFVVTLSTPARLLVDVTGWFTDAAHATTAGRYVALTSSRLYDSRATHATIPAGHTRTLTVTGTNGVPRTGVQAVVLNVAAVSPQGSGYITQFTGHTRPGVSMLSYLTGVARADRAFATPDSNGRLNFYASATTDLVVDVNGYIADSAAGGYYVPVDPQRRVDTRGLLPTGAITSGDNATPAVANGPVPRPTSLAPPVAVVGTISTIPAPTRPGGGYLTAYPHLTDQPPTSDINYTATQVIGNLAVLAPGTDGRVTLAVSATRSGVDVTFDLSGYFARALPASTPAGVWSSDFYSPGVAPVSANGLRDVRQVAGLDVDTIALRSDGTVWAWSDDSHPPGDDPTYTGTEPSKVAALSGITAIAAGRDAAYALDSTGQVWSWGANDHGQLGDGTTTSRSAPQVVPGLTSVTRIFATRQAAYAVTSGGDVHGWGSNNEASLGDGTSTDQPTPVTITGVSDPVSIGGNGVLTRAVLGDGSLAGWGNTTNSTPRPVTSPCPGAATSVTSSVDVLCADGTVPSRPGVSGVTALVSSTNGYIALLSNGQVAVESANGSTWSTVPGLSAITAVGADTRHPFATTGA